MVIEMKKEEFLNELEQRLSAISEEERADAMAFYRSYLEDAGEENEESVIAELESPEKIAENIIRDMGFVAKMESCAEDNTTTDTVDSQAQGTTADNNTNQSANKTYTNVNMNTPKQDNTAMIILIVIVAVLTFPIWGSVLATIASLALGLVCALFGIAVAIVAVMFALIVVGFVLGGIGIGTLISGTPAVGIGLIGGGCIVLALGILAVNVVAWCFGVFLPWVVKGIFCACKSLWNKGKERMAS